MTIFLSQIEMIDPSRAPLLLLPYAARQRKGVKTKEKTKEKNGLSSHPRGEKQRKLHFWRARPPFFPFIACASLLVP